jgi:hypothetical protein
MGQRFVDARWIRQRMDEKDARINRELVRNASPKPMKGAFFLERKLRRAERIASEQTELQAALKRDGRKCRFPGCRGKLRGLDLPIDPCHVRQPDGTKHRKMGGDPTGHATDRQWTIALCRQCHGLYDAGAIDIEALTDDGMDGAVAFYRKHDETGVMEHVATERAR